MIYRLSVEGAASAKANLDNVARSFQSGEASASQLIKATREYDRANAQVSNSINRMANAFRAAHPNLNLLERSMGRVSSVARTILGLFDSWNILQIALSGKSKNTAQAQDEVEKATRKYQQALLDFGKDSPKTIEAWQELQAAQNKLKEAQDESAASAQQAAVQLGLMGITAVGQVGHLVSLAGALKGVSIAGAAGVAGPALLAVGLGVLGASIFKATSDAISFRNAVGHWPTTMEEARTLTQSLADAIPVLGPVLAELTAHLTVAAGKIGEWGEGTQKALFESLTGAGKVIGSWGDSVVEWFAALPSRLTGAITDIGSFITSSFFNFLTDAGKVVGSWGSSVVAWFTALPDRIGTGLGYLATVIGNSIKAALNLAINLLNGWIGFVNTLINGINAISSLAGAPGIPLLGQLPHLAKGTSSFQGGLAVVGEEGPEIAAFPTGTRVYPTGTSPGGISVQVNITGFVGSKHELVGLIATELKTRLTGLYQ